jgi:hypoxanthine phosphoribosyltransferase
LENGVALPFPWDDDPELGRVVLTADQVAERVAELGAKVSADYAGIDRPLLCVSVLKGALIFTADLARNLTISCELDFMAVASYGAATRSSGVVRIVKDLDADLTGRHVLIVEDIVDSGLTLAWLRRNLETRGPASLAVCALLVKEGMQRGDPDLRYSGFTIPPDFVVGYGLDVDQRYRNLPFVCLYRGA